MLIFVYDLGMASLDQYLDEQLARGRAYFSREEALDRLKLAPEAFSAALTRLIKKRRLANPRHGFYLILRPEDHIRASTIEFHCSVLRRFMVPHIRRQWFFR